MDLHLEGKYALVCGASQGIGRAAAEELAMLGANVIALARNADSLKAMIEGLDTIAGQKHDFIAADHAKPTELAQAVQRYIADKKIAINILVNNTGGPPSGPITNASTEEFLSAFNNHLICNQLLAQSLLEGMKTSGYGRVINVISTSVKVPLNGLGVSNTIRGAVASWAKTWANEVGQYGITVNNVLPGATETGRLSSIISTKSTKTQHSEEEITAEMQKEIPLKRFAKPEEVGAAIAYLASPAAAYINGINLPVDGGRTGSL